MSGPFTLREARAAGLTKRQLESACWHRIGPQCYVWAGLGTSEHDLLTAAASRLDATAVFSGLTAARIHGLDVQIPDRIEVTVPEGPGICQRPGLTVHRAQFEADEVVIIDGHRVTSIPRTLVDVARRIRLVEAVVAADSALHKGFIDGEALQELTRSWARRKGVRRLRRVVGLVDPGAESAMETRLRLLLVLNGLPRPLSQVELRAETGQFLGRVDLYYPDARLAIEYDGGIHRDSLVQDDRRQNLLVQSGYTVLRFTAADVYTRKDETLTQVRRALRFVTTAT